MGRRRGRSEDFFRTRWGGVVGFGRKFSGLSIAEVGGVGGREKLAGGSAGGMCAGTITEWRSRLGVMSSDYSDWIS